MKKAEENLERNNDNLFLDRQFGTLCSNLLLCNLSNGVILFLVFYLLIIIWLNQNPEDKDKFDEKLKKTVSAVASSIILLSGSISYAKPTNEPKFPDPIITNIKENSSTDTNIEENSSTDTNIEENSSTEENDLLSLKAQKFKRVLEEDLHQKAFWQRMDQIQQQLDGIDLGNASANANSSQESSDKDDSSSSGGFSSSDYDANDDSSDYTPLSFYKP